MNRHQHVRLARPFHCHEATSVAVCSHVAPSRSNARFRSASAPRADISARLKRTLMPFITHGFFTVTIGLLASAVAAQAAAVKETFETLSLLGTWAINCAAPASEQ